MVNEEILRMARHDIFELLFKYGELTREEIEEKMINEKGWIITKEAMRK